MRKVLITESSLRGLLRELMNSHAPIFPNPVVDPQAAETDPTNQNFVPSDKVELMSALRALVDPIDNERVPQVYVAVKDAIEKEEAEMKDTHVESIIRKAVRKILKESLLNEETATEKKARFAKKLHSTPIFMSVSKSVADDLGIEYDIKNVSGEMVKVDLSSLNPEDKSKLIAANREAGTFSKVGDPGKSGKSLSEEERRLKFIKDSAELRETLNKSIFLRDNEKKDVLDGVEQTYENEDSSNGNNICDALLKGINESGSLVDDAVERFYAAYNQTVDLIREMESNEEITEEDAETFLTPSVLINSRTFKEIYSRPFKKIVDGNFNDVSLKVGDTVLKSITEKGYYSGEGESLEKIKSEVGLSTSGIRKESLIALGKFIITLRALQEYPKFIQYLDETDPEEIIKYSAWNPEE